MGQYLHKFDAEEDFNEAYNGEDYHEPWVSYTIGKKPVSVKKFKAIVNGTINGVTYTNEEHTFTVIGNAGFGI